jgi:RNA polymerase sigma-70 factor (ECF subfamily)
MMRARPAAGHTSFEALYRRHAEAVYLWALRYANGRTGWAEDLVHEVFLKVWQHHARLREEDVKGWLFRVTQNLAFRQLRRERLLGSSVEALRGIFGHRTDLDTPEVRLQRKRDARSATEALGRLPGQERVVVGLKILDGLSQREIADLLELSEGYVSKLLARAFSRLAADGWEVGDDAS